MERTLFSAVANPALQSACARLKGQTGTGQYLEGIADVVRGNRYIGFPLFPVVTVSRGPSPPTSQTFGSVDWQLPIRLTAFVQATQDPADAEDLAVEYASRAFLALLTDPETNQINHDLPGVGVLKAGNFEPPAEHPTEPHIYMARVSAMATVTSTF